MILSHKHKFIYIKTYKTASTSIETALAEICGTDDIITPTSQKLMQTRKGLREQNWRLDHPLVPKRPLWRKLLGRPERFYHPTVGYYEHMPAWRVKAYIGDEIWNSYYKFTFERNPWDREVSWYFYKTKSKDPRPSFEKFLANKKRAWVENYDLYSIDSKPCMDYIGRYENLNEDFEHVLELINLKGKVSLPTTNVSKKKEQDYQKYFSDENRDLMAEWYQREIELFDYKF